MNLDLLGVYGAGLLTFVTPCVLPLIPIYLSMMVGSPVGAGKGEEAGRFRLLSNTAFFALGFLLVFVALGLSATFLGKLLSAHRDTLMLIGGLIIFLFGLKFLGFLRIGFLERERRLDDRKLNLSLGPLNSFVMGFVFALGWTPCVGPILGSVLTYTASRTSNLWMGGVYLGVYGLGFATPLFLVALGAGAAVRLLRRISSWMPRFEKVTGLLLVGIGFYLMLGVVRVPKGGVLPTKKEQASKSAKSPSRKVAPLVAQTLGQPSKRPRLVEFVSKNCPICRQMIPTMAVLRQECAKKRGLIEVVEVDVSLPPNRGLASRFRIRGVPTFVFLDKEGQEVARLVGYQRLQALRQALSLLTGGVCDGVGRLPQDHSSQAPPQGSSPSSQTPTQGYSSSSAAGQPSPSSQPASRPASQPALPPRRRPATETPATGAACPPSLSDGGSSGQCADPNQR